MTDETTFATPPAQPEPPEPTPVQLVLLDAMRDVALSEAPGAKYAAEHLVRLTAAAFDNPLPEPVPREGGLASFLYGRPVVTNPTTPKAPRAAGGIVKPGLAIVASGGAGKAPGKYDDEHAVTPEPWPFKPGDIVEDAEGAVTEWLDAAPVGTVVADAAGDEWKHEGLSSWVGTYRIASSDVAARGSVTVVTVGPGQ
jgi:hypothetical protein